MTGSDTILFAYTHNNKFIKELMQFYRFNMGYFSNDSVIHYQRGLCEYTFEWRSK